MSKAPSAKKEETFEASGSPDHQDSGFDLPLAMIVFNSEGRMLSSNPAMAGLLGYSSAEELIRLAGNMSAKFIAPQEDWEIPGRETCANWSMSWNMERCSARKA